MEVEPSQPADLEFVSDGEQDPVLQIVNAHAGAVTVSAQKRDVEQRQVMELEIENDIFNDEEVQGAKSENDSLGKEIQKLDLKESLFSKVKEKKKVRSDGYQLYETYSCMLNLTDISYGEKGHNKFYLIEVLHKGYAAFVLYTKWGRVGAQNPQEQYKKADNKYDAILSFKKKFYEKTHNDWTGMFSDFKVQPGKYTWIQVDIVSSSKGSVNDDIERLNRRNRDLKKKIDSTPSNLGKQLADIMNIVWDFNRINKTLKELNFDTEKNPLGRLTMEQIQKGYRILTEIQNALISGARTSVVIELTNQFYTNIPQSYGMRALPMIDHMSKVKEKLHLLDVLKEVDITSRYINTALAQKESEPKNPLDTLYKMLKCSISHISDTKSLVYQTITKMVNGTHGPTHDKFKLNVVDIFSLDRKTENQKFFPFKQLPDQRLLWHGSRISNFVGILSEGLRIAPPEAPVTGYMFGKGVYLTDIVSKAASYCHAKEDSPEGFLILSQVALGQMIPCNKAKQFKKPPIYYHSVRGVGKMDTAPEGSTVLDGVICQTGKIEVFINDNNDEFETFLGPVIESSDDGDGQPKDLIYNEFIVYDTSQLKMKYLVRVNFSFK